MTRNGTRGPWSIVTGSIPVITGPGSGDLDPGPLDRGPGSAIRDRAGVQLPVDPGPLAEIRERDPGTSGRDPRLGFRQLRLIRDP